MTTLLVVGLGNPGPAYAPTRHNVGFLALDDLADRLGASFSPAVRFHGSVATAHLPPTPGKDPVRLVLAKPSTFMNASGQCVGALAAFYKIEPLQLVVVHDELDLEPGQLRIKFGGGDNGHNGLKSIRQHLGTGEFTRVRIGIGRPPGRQPASDYVLAKVSPKGFDELLLAAAVAADAVEYFAANDLASAQNRFNS